MEKIQIDLVLPFLLQLQAEIKLPDLLKLKYHQDIKIEKQIGKGGAIIISTGIVLNPEIKVKFGKIANDVVIVKQIADNPKLAKPENLARFHQEVSIMNSLLFHPNVVLLLGYTEAPNCFITPFYEGTLSEWIHARDKQYNTLHVADIVYQICYAMNALHARGVAHRDLKPQNILLEKNHEKQPEQQLGKKKPGRWSDFAFTLKLAEFGLCCVNRKDNLAQDFKILNPSAISHPYASPELLSGSPKLSFEHYEKGDLYSFGISLWELLHRTYPWHRLPSQEITEKVMQNQRPEIRLEAKQDKLLAHFLPLIKACWNENAFSRPTFGNVLVQFRSFMETGTIQQHQNFITL